MDVYHASNHLWARADHLFDEGSPQFRHGRSDFYINSATAVNNRHLSSENLMNFPPPQHTNTAEKITTTAQYFLDRQEHIHYAALANSGSMPTSLTCSPSTCSHKTTNSPPHGPLMRKNGDAPFVRGARSSLLSHGPFAGRFFRAVFYSREMFDVTHFFLRRERRGAADDARSRRGKVLR